MNHCHLSSTKPGTRPMRRRAWCRSLCGRCLAVLCFMCSARLSRAGDGLLDPDPAPYHGGPIIPNVKVVMVLYGPGNYVPEVGGTAQSTPMDRLYGQLVNGQFMDRLCEYNTTISADDGSPGTNQTIARGTFLGRFPISPATIRDGTTITEADIQSELQDQFLHNYLPQPDANTLYMIHFPIGKITPGLCTAECGHHGYFFYNSAPVYYAVLPENACCGTDFASQSIVASHELGEAITDPHVGDAWVSELGDLCAWLPTTFQGTDNVTYTIQKFWSNARVPDACTGPATCQYGIRASIVGNGGILANPPSHQFDPGSSVVLTAVPAASWTFAGWSLHHGSNWGPVTTLAGNQPLALQMNSNTNVTATFRRCPYPLASKESTRVERAYPETYAVSLPTQANWAVAALRSSGYEQCSYPWYLTQANTVDANCNLSGIPVVAQGPAMMTPVLFAPLSATRGGTSYLEAQPGEFGGVPAVIEYDVGHGPLGVNGISIAAPPARDEIISVWNVTLAGGQQVTVNFDNMQNPTRKCLVYHPSNPTDPTWRSRFLGVADNSDVTTFSGDGTYVAADAGTYAVAVVDDSWGCIGAAQTPAHSTQVIPGRMPPKPLDGPALVAHAFTLGVSTCPPAPILPPDTVVAEPASINRHTTQQLSRSWAAVGVRGTNPGDSWHIDVYQNPTGGQPPTCFGSSLVHTSFGRGGVDFAIGDFNMNPLWNYYLQTNRSSGSSAGRVEWAAGGQMLGVGDSLTTRSTGTAEVVAVWDVYLAGGESYDFLLQHGGSASLELLLFHNPTNGQFWSSRGQQVFSTAHTGTYSAPDTGYYGVVVVNDNGASDTYDIGVFAGGSLAVDGSQRLATGIEAIAPNPSRGLLEVEFGLSRAGVLGIDLVDVAGRRVAGAEFGRRAPGRQSVRWNAVGSGGSRIRPGIYFVRLMLDGQSVGGRRIVLIR
jgi:hypothetical protein